MTKRDYEAAALIVQDIARYELSKNTLCVITDAFVELFRHDNSRFDVERFRRACVPGANVKARS